METQYRLHELLKAASNFFKHDLTNVKIHIGDYPKAFGSYAFVFGNNVFVCPEMYSTLNPTGQFILGHELCHIVQQREGRVNSEYCTVNKDEQLELEANICGLVFLSYLQTQRPTSHSMAGNNFKKSATPSPPVIQMLRVGFIPDTNWRKANVFTQYDLMPLMNRHDCADFTATMRHRILDFNSARQQVAMQNGNVVANPLANVGPGALMSDISRTILHRPQRFVSHKAEVDHIIEYQHWGSNDFRNARVISSLENQPNQNHPRPSANQREVVCLESIQIPAYQPLNLPSINIGVGTPLTLQQLRILLNLAKHIHDNPPQNNMHNFRNPTHHVNNQLQAIHNIDNNDMWALYANLPQT